MFRVVQKEEVSDVKCDGLVFGNPLRSLLQLVNYDGNSPADKLRLRGNEYILFDPRDLWVDARLILALCNQIAPI